MLDFLIFAWLYRAIKNLLEVISRNWVMILVFILLAVFLGIAWGSFFIAAYVLLEHKNSSVLFNPKIFISLGLSIFNFYGLTTEFYKDFPIIYKGAVLSNTVGLFLSVFYLSKFIKLSQLRLSAFALFGVISIFILSPALFIYNSAFNVSGYMLAERKHFHSMITQEKRVKYKAAFEAFVRSHRKIKTADFPKFSIECKKIYDSNYGEESEISYKTDDLIVVEITSLIEDTRYTYERDGSVDVLFYLASLNGMDADYYNGKIYYKKDIKDESGYGRVEWAQENGQSVSTEISFGVKVMENNIDSYIRYIEGKVTTDYKDEIMISKNYLQEHNIPVTPTKITPVQKTDL